MKAVVPQRFLSWNNVSVNDALAADFACLAAPSLSEIFRTSWSWFAEEIYQSLLDP
jgi:hypothetical protein